MPLPLVAKTPAELALKTEAERIYLTFNLLAGGKTAYDAGDYARAARKWEALLRLPDLAPSVRAAVAPLLTEARRQAGLPSPAAEAPSLPTVETPAVAITSSEPARPTLPSVSGVVTGGGNIGPGGTVLWLKRLDGPMPQVRGMRRVISQKDKRFVPRVLAIPVGSTVDFRNDDGFYHNVFSLSEAQRFDTGLYPAHLAQSQRFDKPGPVELLCNIHASMLGYLYVVDSPYYTQPRASGAFSIRRVPPGKYELSAWHEAAQEPVRHVITVGPHGADGVQIHIPADRGAVTARPDKYGKPRQVQLGY